MGKKCHLSDFECAMGVGDRQDGLSISETADLLGFFHTSQKKKRKYDDSNNHSFCQLKTGNAGFETQGLTKTGVQAGGGGVVVWRIFSRHTLGPLVPCVRTAQPT